MEENLKTTAEEGRSNESTELRPLATSEKSREPGRAQSQTADQLQPSALPVAREGLSPRRDERHYHGPEKAKFSDVVMVVATCVMALATIAIGIVAYFQWWDSSKLNDAATKAAAAADKFKDSAAHIETFIQQAQGNMRTMADSSKQSIQATQDSMRLDERAWVGIGLFRVVQLDDKQLRIDIETVNSGKTPALSRTEAFNIRWDPQVRKGPPEDLLDKLEFQAAEALPPQGHHTMHIELNWKDLALYKLVQDEKTFVSVFGEIRYKDVFGGKTHSTDFCLWLVDPNTKDLGFCDAGNSMN